MASREKRSTSAAHLGGRLHAEVTKDGRTLRVTASDGEEVTDEILLTEWEATALLRALEIYVEQFGHRTHDPGGPVESCEARVEVTRGREHFDLTCALPRGHTGPHAVKTDDASVTWEEPR